MLRIGISKQDRVFEPTKETLNDAGYRLRGFGRTEEVDLPDDGIRFIGVKDISQVAVMIESGELDGLLLGADIALEAQALLDSTLAVNSLLDLERSKCRIAPIVMPETLGKIDFLLSKYPGLSNQYLQQDAVQELLERNAQDIKVRAFGSGADVQIRRSFRQNQMATDIVETGNTVRQNGGLIIDDPLDAEKFGIKPLPAVIKSSLQLFSVGDLDNDQDQTITELKRRIEYVIDSNKFMVIKYNARLEDVEKLTALTPQRKNPTQVPAGEGMVAVEVMVEAANYQSLIFKLEQAGAQSLIALKPQIITAQ